MTQRLRVFVLLVGIAVGGAGSFQGSKSRSPEDHTTWVAEALQRMLTVKPGMTRGDFSRFSPPKAACRVRGNALTSAGTAGISRLT